MDHQAVPQVVVIGSGAGGAVTALTLAEQGIKVLVLEEGARHALTDYGGTPTKAMRSLYRQRGMTPIMGKIPIGYVEGCCLGGSTEINSGFWHRAPREILMRWNAQYDLEQASEADLRPHFEWAEEQLGVGLSGNQWPASTKAFARGAEAMGWSFQEVPRAAPGCRNTNACAQGCPTGAKQGMSQRIIPAAERHGAMFLANCRARFLIKRRGRIKGIIASLKQPDGTEQIVRIGGDNFFVCCGPTQTPALLQRSGVKGHVGNSLRIHPYLKVAACFDEPMDSDRTVLPLLQVKEFWPEISFGGAYFTPGHLSMILGENWPQTRDDMKDFRRMAAFYVGVKGTGRGTVRTGMLGDETAQLRYDLSHEDRVNLSKGLAHLSSLLLAAGARKVIPAVYGISAIETERQAIRWLDETLPRSSLSLTAVHAFSSCPIGERSDRCAANSFGKVFGYENLYINDASMLPDSPGVNPQGSVMAVARRNCMQFIRG